MKSNKITIEGFYDDNQTHTPPNTHTININNIPNYRGLTQNGTGSGGNFTAGSGYSNITVQNINLTTSGSTTLYTSSNNESGWICQSYWSGITSLTNNLVYRCSSSGLIPNYAGGIIGVYSGGIALKCFSTGDLGQQSGGIYAGACFGIASCCYSSGNFNGEGSGGIFGNVSDSGSKAICCYSKGQIKANNAGGIFGVRSSASGTNSYCSSTLTSGLSNVGGIFGNNTTNAIDANHCYILQPNFIGGGSGTTTSITNSFAQSNGSWSDTNANKYLLWGPNNSGNIWTSPSANKPYNLYPLNNIVPFTISSNNLYPIVTLGSSSFSAQTINLSSNNFIPNYTVTWNIDNTSTATGTFNGNNFTPTSIGVIKIYGTINPIINGNRIYSSNDGSINLPCKSNTLLIIATTASSYNSQITDPSVSITNSSSYTFLNPNESKTISSPPNDNNIEVIKTSPSFPASATLNVVKKTNSDGTEILQFQMYNPSGQIITNSPGTDTRYFIYYSTLKKINNLTNANSTPTPISLIQNEVIQNSAYIEYIGQNQITGLNDYVIKQ